MHAGGPELARFQLWSRGRTYAICKFPSDPLLRSLHAKQMSSWRSCATFITTRSSAACARRRRGAASGIIGTARLWEWRSSRNGRSVPDSVRQNKWRTPQSWNSANSGPPACGQNYKFTGKERDSETGLDYFGARYYGSNMARLLSADPLMINALRIVNPQRLNLYAYAVNNPLTFIDPDGKDAIAVNFPALVPAGGHSGIIVVHSDGSAMYARFGPQGGTKPYGPGEVVTQKLTPIKFQSNGLPTDASYQQLAQEVAKVEGAPAITVGLNYFKTSDADTVALQNWMDQMQAISDAGNAPDYRVNSQNCATFCIAGLLRANAIQNRNISIIPNRLFLLLAPHAAENWTWQGRKPNPEPKPKRNPKPPCLKRRDGTCVD